MLHGSSGQVCGVALATKSKHLSQALWFLGWDFRWVMFFAATATLLAVPELAVLNHRYFSIMLTVVQCHHHISSDKNRNRRREGATDKIRMLTVMHSFLLWLQFNSGLTISVSLGPGSSHSLPRILQLFQFSWSPFLHFI